MCFQLYRDTSSSLTAALPSLQCKAKHCFQSATPVCQSKYTLASFSEEQKFKNVAASENTSEHFSLLYEIPHHGTGLCHRHP